MVSAIKAVLLIILLLKPEFELHWVTQGDTSRLRASLRGYESELATCLSSGLSVRYRYEFELCRRRRFWFDDCEGNRTAISNVEFDPISETYAVSSDLLGDRDPPVVERVTDVPKALAIASNRSDIPLSWLSRGKELGEVERQRFRGRVSAECRGEYSESMKRLSYILSFGLRKSSGYDSGWVEFER